MPITLEGPELEAFFGSAPGPENLVGRLPFEVRLEDMLFAARPSSDVMQIPYVEDNNHRYNAASPVVLEVFYRAVREDGSIVNLRDPPNHNWSGLGLAGPLVTTMGDAPCPPNAPTRVSSVPAPSLSGDLIEMCGARVSVMRPTASEIEYLDPEEDGVSETRDSLCGPTPRSLSPGPFVGHPLFGQWTLTFNDSMAITEATLGERTPLDADVAAGFREANAEVDRLDILFVVFSEALRHGAQPGFTPLAP